MKFTASLFFGSLALLSAACRTSGPVDERRSEIESPLVSGTISNQQIKAIAEDAQGHIWIGTFRGLNKYNAHEYQQYFCTDDSLSLCDNQIQDLMRDSHGRLWVATVNGPCIYTDQDDFRRIPLRSDNRNILQLFEDRTGRIFAITCETLYEYDEGAGRFDPLLSGLDPDNTFHVRCHVDSSNRLWIVNSRELRCYDLVARRITDTVPLKDFPYYSYLHNGRYLYLSGYSRCRTFDTWTGRFDEVPDVIRRHPLFAKADVTYIHPYNDDCLLFNTARHGMFCYDFVHGTFIHQQQTGFPFEVPPFKIRSMFTDSQRNLWIGSEDQGYTVCYHYKTSFNSNNYLRSELANKSVVSVAADREANLWIVTLMDGLYVYDLRRYGRAVPLREAAENLYQPAFRRPRQCRVDDGFQSSGAQMPLPQRGLAGRGPAFRLPAHVRHAGCQRYGLGRYGHPFPPCAGSGQKPFRADAGVRRFVFVHSRFVAFGGRLFVGGGVQPAA